MNEAHRGIGKSRQWGTPRDLFKRLDDLWGPFDLDVAASDDLHVVENYFTEQDDAFTKDWIGRIFMNPPYGRDEQKWIEYGLEEIIAGHAQLVCAVLPNKTEKKWFQQYVLPLSGRNEAELWYLADLEFLPGRLKFIDPMDIKKHNAPMGSIVAVWARKHER